MLQQLDHLPERLLSLEANQLHDVLGGPTIIYLAGRRQPELFISVLMHGNETTGWDAIRNLLNHYLQAPHQHQFPRSIALFIGNTEAAKHGVRHLSNQPDYNRVWPGTEYPPCPEQAMMQEVVDIMRSRDIFASVDVHNNTGLNPHYACVNKIDPATLHLATLFGRSVVYFTKPSGVASMAMMQLCPSVTLECGKIGQRHSTQHAWEYLDACLHLSAHPVHEVAPHDIDLFHTTAIVKVAEDVSFGYSGNDLDLLLDNDLEHYNFTELQTGTTFGKLLNQARVPFEVTDEHGENVYHRYFESSADVIRTRMEVMPSMLTPDVQVIRQDCLCYLMERYNYVARQS